MSKPAMWAKTTDDGAWQQYCYFLRLSMEEFQAIQNELLEESLGLVAQSSLAQTLLGRVAPSFRELRRSAPLTTYQDYAPYFDRQDDSVLAQKPVFWAYTSTSGGAGKWVPYTARGREVMLDYLMAALLLASAREPGQGRVEAGAVGVYNVAPRPYLSGYLAHGICQRFGFRTVPPLEVAEGMEFAERVEKGFQMALRSGVDVLCSLSSVLVRMGERFTDGQRGGSFSRAYLHPLVLSRLARAIVCSRLQRRHMLPKDLWRVKALIGWGLDTSLYREKIEYYWGMAPYEFYACTEAGVLALQAWNKKGLTLLPQTAFFEFIPEEEWAGSGQDEGHRPATVLLDEVEAGRRYELVLTSYHGMPFIRYRSGHIVKVLSKDDPETGVSLPQVAFVGRADGVIDLAGFTRLDEKTLWQAIYRSQLPSFDWIATKESENSTATLHLYIEAGGDAEEAEALRRLHHSLKEVDPAYRDLESMLGLVPLRVSLLAPGTFQRYYQERQRRGESLVEARLPHINPPPAALEELLRMSNRSKP